MYKYIVYLGVSGGDVKKLVTSHDPGAEIKLTRYKIVYGDDEGEKRLLAIFGLIERE